MNPSIGDVLYSLLMEKNWQNGSPPSALLLWTEPLSLVLMLNDNGLQLV